MFSSSTLPVIKGAFASARQGLLKSRRRGVINHGSVLGPKLSTLSKSLPKGTWCSHMHIVEPKKFPLDAKAQYQPHPHTIADARSFYEPLGIKNMVIVQPSIYANDNSCTLHALRELTPQHGRAVVQFDPKTIKQRTLDDWHDLGVRGVRVNLVSVGRELSEEDLRTELTEYADVIRRLDWVLEIYIPLRMATVLEKIVTDLDVKVCIDHFGQPTLPTPYDPTTAIKPYDLPGFTSLVNLLQANTWVKLSGQYRISKDPEMRDLEPLAIELLKMAPDRVVFATDWPHTRFENVDTKTFIEACFRWCGEGTGLAEKLFVTNAEELWDVLPSKA
jgi:predicted TIM-barrel fold metal-dependent hydrolase